MRQVRAGVWQLTAPSGKYSDGTPRRVYRTVTAPSTREASVELASFVAEAQSGPLVIPRDVRDLTVNQAIDLFLNEHLRAEKGREEKTIRDYRLLHAKWFAPDIGARRMRDLDEAILDKAFGRMRRAGLSRSRLNQAKSLYSPFLRWAKRRNIISRNLMADFQLPTSRYRSKERAAPEVDELSIFLREALAMVPDIAPVLTLGAVTGMRRGELVGVRRSDVAWAHLQVTVKISISERGIVKGTKTRRERNFHVDAHTMDMLQRHCIQMDERARVFGTTIEPSAFLFSLEPDCSRPMPPGYITRRVAVLKDHLGISDKRPETVDLEDEALRLRREAPGPRPQGKTGPLPAGGQSFDEIGKRLDRSGRWAMLAVASAERREASALRDVKLGFDGSILALRKFTSSELLDAGFNISMVAQRQGHGPQVLMKHYAKARQSADRRAAEHLGRAVHGPRVR
jgi:integrase